MIINLDWTLFQQKYLSNSRIFIIENDADWTLYTNDDIFVVKCIVEKYADQTENIMFVERYLNHPGIMKILSISETDEEKETEEEEMFNEFIEDSDEELIEIKHKYIRRIGSSGKYRYFYNIPKKKKELLEKRESLVSSSDDINEVVDSLGDNYKEALEKYRKNKYNLAEGLNKTGTGLGGRYQIMKELSKAVYDKFSDDIHGTLLDAPKRYDPTEVSDEQIREWRGAINTTSEGLRDMVRDSVSSEDERMKIIKDLRDKTGNDTTKINKVLGFMGFKERVKKDGLRGKKTTSKTKEEIKETLKKLEHNGVKYNISPNQYKKLKGSDGKTLFKSESEQQKFIEKALDRLPPKTGEQLAKTSTEVNFVSKNEEKILRNAYRGVSGSTAGIYDPNTKQIYIYPKTFEGSTTLSKEKLKADGISDSAIDKLTNFDEKENWGQTIIHEVGHGIQLNLAGKGNRINPGESSPIEQKWDEMKHSDKYRELEKRTSPGEKDNRYISRYARTNDHEDMAETFAFYARYRPYLKEAIQKNKKWLNPVLAEKFKFMERLWK